MIPSKEASGVELEDLGTALIVGTNEDHGCISAKFKSHSVNDKYLTNAKRAHARSLRVDLVDIGHALSHYMSARLGSSYRRRFYQLTYMHQGKFRSRIYSGMKRLLVLYAGLVPVHQL
jgi:hypothetical protein